VSRAVPTRPELTPGARLSTFLRALLIQGSWNYRTMLGSGIAFALLPVLRRLAVDETELRESVDRHLEHFNAHPYLATLALGAVLRLEEDEADPSTVRRLKIALRGPLGSLGDSLVWATVLPAVSLGALALFWMGVAPWIAVGAFFLIFNAVHLSLRVWGFRAGVDAGRDVGRRLAQADLSGWTRKLEPVVVILLGLLAGAVVGGGGGLVDAGALWLSLSGLAFVVGLLGGHRAWRPAAALTVFAIAAVAVAGVLA